MNHVFLFLIDSGSATKLSANEIHVKRMSELLCAFYETGQHGFHDRLRATLYSMKGLFRRIQRLYSQPLSLQVRKGVLPGEGKGQFRLSPAKSCFLPCTSHLFSASPGTRVKTSARYHRRTRSLKMSVMMFRV